MNLTYSIDKTARLVSLSYSGDPDFNEWAETMRAVFRDPSYEPGFSIIVDRRLVKTAPTTDYIEKIAAFSRAHPAELGKCRTAVIVSELASYGMARMSQALLHDTEHTRVFTGIDEAKRWLFSQNPHEST